MNAIKVAERVRKMKMEKNHEFRIAGATFLVQPMPRILPEAFMLTTRNSRPAEYRALEIMQGPKNLRYSDFVHHLRCTTEENGSPIFINRKHLIDVLVNDNFSIG
jgi:ribosomal protein L20